MAHAAYPPSAMARILPCPPSGPLAANLPDRSTAQGEEGTRVHKVVETALRTGVDPQPYPWAHTGTNMPDHEVVARIRAYIAQLGPGQLLTEHIVKLSNDVWGTLDLAHISDNANQIPTAQLSAAIITVFDYKNGGFDVLARDNKQLLTYAATFLDSYPHVLWFRLVVFQPNSWGSQGDDFGFKQHVHSRAEVEAHRDAVAAAVAYTGPPRPGPHCRWCKAVAACPAMSQDAYFLMSALARSADPQQLSPHELVRMLRIIRAVSDMQTTLEGYLTNMLKMGAQVEGAGLKKSTRWEQWNDERHAAQTLFQHYGVRGVKPLTVSQAKKLGTVGEQYAASASHRPVPELKASY